MSGGRFDYLDEHAKGEIFGWADEPSNVFEDKEISMLIWDVFDLIHEYDWYASGDNSEETYLKAKAEFKAKWLKHDEKRIQMIIDDAIDEVRQELYKTYGIEQKVCEVSDCDYHKYCRERGQTDCVWKEGK